MTVPRSRKGLINQLNEAPPKVRSYFEHLPRLLADFPLDVSLSYVFSQVELAHNMTLYCGVVKLHRAHATLARTAIDTHRMSRSDFKEKYETVFGKAFPDAISEKLHQAEQIRDRVMHGKSTTDKQKREGIANVIEYAQEFNDFVASVASFRAFGDLRGFKGRAKGLHRSTTRWVLKGMGFLIS